MEAVLLFLFGGLLIYCCGQGLSDIFACIPYIPYDYNSCKNRLVRGCVMLSAGFVSMFLIMLEMLIW